MTSPRRVLVVDDEPAMRDMLASLLEEAGIASLAAEGVEAALAALGSDEFDAVVSDIRMPGADGFELLGAVREHWPQTPVVLMTAFGSIDSAVEAMRSGAYDYITKPFHRDAVLATLERAFERRALEQENRRLRRAVDRTAAFGDLIGTSDAMREIFALIRKVAASRASVLIRGESGTGKEVVARTLHFASPRAEAAFVPINCTAMPEGLLESELFGHVRGAFTGAHANKKGLFEEAEGGTLFLDEIGDMSPLLQAKLLRVLQDGEVRPVGANRGVRVDVRVVAATNKDLPAEIEAGRFRQDLFYRLNVVAIDIPPLRERPEDIPLLAKAFLRRHDPSSRMRLSPAALEALRICAWEGNGRELENAIERALLLASGDRIEPEDLPVPAGQTRGASSATDDLLARAAQQRLTLRELGDLYTEQVLELTGGNKVQAARILGINRRTLYRRDRGHLHGRDAQAEET